MKPRPKRRVWKAWGVFTNRGENSVLVLSRVQRSEAERIAEMNELIVREVEIRLAPAKGKAKR